MARGSCPPRSSSGWPTRVPVVIFAGTRHEQAVDVVAADNLSGSAAVVTHLIREHGRRRLYRVDGPLDLAGLPRAAARPRLRAARQPAKRAHRLLPGVLQRPERRGGRRGTAGQAPAASCRTRSSPPTTRWPSAWSRRCPGPVSGCRRTWPWSASTTSSPGSLCDPPLTTVHQPMRMLGERSCARLLERIANPGLRPATELLPTELVLRSSCGCPPGTVVREPVPTLRFRGRNSPPWHRRISPDRSPQPGRRPARQAAKA